MPSVNHNLLWYAISVLVTDVFYRNKTYVDNLDGKFISSSMKNNVFTCMLRINYITCKIHYTFSSNIAIEGTLTITNMNTYEVNKFQVERYNDSMRISRSKDDYHEIYGYLDKKFIDIAIKDGIKTEVTNLNIEEETKEGAHVDIVNACVSENRVITHNELVERLLFAVTGAIDSTSTTCNDVICLKCRSLNMVIYGTPKMQVIAVNNEDIVADSTYTSMIFIINSDFKQRFIYSLDNNSNCKIVELIPIVEDSNAIRREYSYHQDKETYIITTEKKKFSVNLEQNNITFSEIQ